MTATPSEVEAVARAKRRFYDVDADALIAAFCAHEAGQTKFTRRMAIIIGDQFGLPPMRVVWRLEQLGMLRRGSWEWFRANGGITKAHEAEARADRAALDQHRAKG